MPTERIKAATSRRRHLLWLVAGLAALRSSLARAADKLAQTRPMALGPFYPMSRPSQTGADLTRLTGRSGRAQGEVVELTGRVLTVDGQPVVGAKIEIWQANAAGRYAHEGDRSGAPLDPNFGGFAQQSTDGQGRYRFLTIRPGAYPAGGFMRSPHVHFDIQGRTDRLITQMYLPADAAMLGQDQVLQHDLWKGPGPEPASVFGKWTAGGSTLEKGAALCEFDIVLGNG